MKRPHRIPTRPDAIARALPMPAPLDKSADPGEPMATALGLPYARVIAGRLTIIQPTEES